MLGRSVAVNSSLTVKFLSHNFSYLAQSPAETASVCVHTHACERARGCGVSQGMHVSSHIQYYNTWFVTEKHVNIRRQEPRIA